MSKTSLKASIATVVKTNGVRSITGSNLRGKLNEIVDELYPTADATALDGTEVIIVQQSGERVETTTQDIADLGGGGGDTWLTLGTVGFADVNAAAADPTVTINLTTNDLPSGYYIERFYVETTQDFASTSLESFSLGTTGIFFSSAAPFVIPLQDYLGGVTGEQFDYGSPATANIVLTFVTTNTQDFTAGSLTVKALIKQFP